jgi:hypothetical protein
MQTDGVGAQRDAAVVNGGDAALSDHRYRTSRHSLGIVNDAAGFSPRLEAAVGSVAAIGEGLADPAQAEAFCSRQQR